MSLCISTRAICSGQRILVQPKAHLTAGIDEAGIGSWAGPLVVCAAIFDDKVCLTHQVKDSKQMSPRQREEVIDRIYATASRVVYVVADASHIDYVGNIWQVWNTAVAYLVRLCFTAGVAVVRVDGKAPRNARYPECLDDFRIVYEPRADDKYREVSAASVVAKYVQSCHMDVLGMKFPAYGFASHRGYGTEKHKKQLTTHGPCVAHRVSYRPVSSVAGTSFRNPADPGEIKAYTVGSLTIDDLEDYCAQRYCYPGRTGQRSVCCLEGHCSESPPSVARRNLGKAL